MRTLIWLIVAVLILGAGYVLFTGESPQDIVDDVQDAIVPAEEAEESADDTTETTEEAEPA
ncbi:MAG: hypothetical protein AAF965_07995, partial [Pseudomonadota bacterium]